MTNPLADAAKLLQSGRFREAEALYRQVAAQSAASADARFGIGLALENQGRLSEAEESYRAALKLRPGFAEAGCNLGSLLLRSERGDEALAVLEAAAAAKPDFLPARLNLGLAYLALGRGADAETAFRAVLKRQPGNLMALNELGRALLQQTKIEEAIDLFRKGHRRQPKEPRFLANLANALELRNDLEGAQAALEQALALAPQAPPLLYAAAKLARRRGDGAAARQALEAMLAQELPRSERADTLLELGQLFDELGEPDAAFARLSEANALRRESPAARRHDGKAFIAKAEAIAQALAEGQFAEAAAAEGDPSESAPIFFVGFPRSGTSLMEQALNAHPRLVTTGERSPLAPIIARLSQEGLYPAHLDRLGAGDLAAARSAFWQGAETLVGPLEGRLLVDKTALNILHLGLVQRLFPNARVIVALRDPRDVCLSCFMQRFQLSEATVNFLDLQQTALTYSAVMGLWLRYREQLSLEMKSYRYEELVADLESTLRGVLAFIGLDWDDRVLKYRESAGIAQVTTPSYHQVAKPIYGSASGRWQRYRAALAPILPTLEPFAEAFDYES